MSSNALDIVRLEPVEVVNIEQHLPPAEPSLKRRLTERFSVPGALVICRHRTIFGTWKACRTPFHVYNLGMGGLNYWNLGKTPKPGGKIKLTLLVPNVIPINVVSVVVWSKAMPRSDDGGGAQRYSHITGVKFVDYDAEAWAVLRKIHEIVAAELKSAPPPALAPSQNQSENPTASAPR
ncbi:MAG: hypothetical protein ABSA67_05465 [Candidatus Brocadiia bacterium]|jgi:hypothetical protein